jgi:hypothetical protein
MKLKTFVSVLNGPVFSIALLLLLACSNQSTSSGSDGEQEKSGDTAKTDDPHLAASLVFLQALTSGDYAGACNALSKYSKARMSLNQFALIGKWEDIRKNEDELQISLAIDIYKRVNGYNL